MSDTNLTLRHHRLSHIPELRVDPDLLLKHFETGCRTDRCGGGCCEGGVWVDLAERDRILAHADLVATTMDDTQDQDPSHWFERGETDDSDFPSGRAAGTEVRNNRCVFLDSARRCTLQKASAGRQGVDLKPFFCRIFPITLEYGLLTLDEVAGSQRSCCKANAGGSLSVFDVCHVELQYVLGTEGVEELRRLVGA